jgi:hypothetical protein
MPLLCFACFNCTRWVLLRTLRIFAQNSHTCKSSLHLGQCWTSDASQDLALCR